MLARETILNEIIRRLLTIPYIKVVFEDPTQPPSREDYPCISLLQRADSVESAILDSTPNGFRNKWDLEIIPFIEGRDGTDEAAAKEIDYVKQDIRKVLYAKDPNSRYARFTLDGLVQAIYETRTSALVKPHRGQPGVGLVISIVVFYTEELESVIGNPAWHYTP